MNYRLDGRVAVITGQAAQLEDLTVLVYGAMAERVRHLHHDLKRKGH